MSSLQPNLLTVSGGIVSADFAGTIGAHGFRFYDDSRGFEWQLQASKPIGSAPQWTLLGPLWSAIKQAAPTWAQIKQGAPTWAQLRARSYT